MDLNDDEDDGNDCPNDDANANNNNANDDGTVFTQRGPGDGIVIRRRKWDPSDSGPCMSSASSRFSSLHQGGTSSRVFLMGNPTTNAGMPR